MARAARTGDHHTCTMHQPSLHHGGPVSSGSTTVLLGDALAARVGDRCDCEGADDDVIARGCATVIIGGKQAARRGDATSGGFVASGMKTVRIGRTPLSELAKRATVTPKARPTTEEDA